MGGNLTRDEGNVEREEGSRYRMEGGALLNRRSFNAFMTETSEIFCMEHCKVRVS